MSIILDTDSYKASHWVQYPQGTTKIFSYLESRGGRYSNTVFFGLQMILSKLERVITSSDVEEAANFFKAHGEPFNSQGWMGIVLKLGGRLPLRIRAVPEGSVVPVNNVLMTVENTQDEYFWLTSWVETVLMRVWYPTTVATQSWHIKKIILDSLEKTSDNPAQEIQFKLHDFGSRGVSSETSAGIGGAAHLVNFMGSDTVSGVVYANRFYDCKMAGFSIPAAEHSTITTWGKDGELQAYQNMLTQYAKPGALVAVVSDSYDLDHAIDAFWCGTLKEAVINSGATVVIRPDSGNPPEIVLRTLQKLEKAYGATYNSKSYKVLNSVRVIQGDGVNEDSIREILKTINDASYSTTNVAFGMGGALLQQVNRDTQRFAYKCSAATINGEEIEVFKDPKTDPMKRSKKGRLDLVLRGGEYSTIAGSDNWGSVLRTVFEDGEIKRKQTFADIRATAALGT